MSLELSGDALLDYVRQVAAELAARLTAGERETGGWLDAAATTQLVNRDLAACLDQLSQSGCWGPANRLPSSELWRLAGEWLQAGSLLSQARFKPRGYAGDFDLLNKICDRWRCSHPLGAALDEFFQAQAAPQAVRNRTQLVARACVEQCRLESARESHWVSIGSGPARDIEQALGELSADERPRVRVTLLDLDPAALDFARARLAKWLPDERICCARENLFRLPKNARCAALLRGADLISCAGFFDYLGADEAASLLACLWRELAPGGKLLVFNFTPANPSRAYMEWIGNWYLVYRELPDLAELGQRAGLPDECLSIGSEELGVDAFLEARKP